jgi:hypothetical protein
MAWYLVKQRDSFNFTFTLETDPQNHTPRHTEGDIKGNSVGVHNCHLRVSYRKRGSDLQYRPSWHKKFNEDSDVRKTAASHLFGAREPDTALITSYQVLMHTPLQDFLTTISPRAYIFFEE